MSQSKVKTLVAAVAAAFVVFALGNGVGAVAGTPPPSSGAQPAIDLGLNPIAAAAAETRCEQAGGVSTPAPIAVVYRPRARVCAPPNTDGGYVIGHGWVKWAGLVYVPRGEWAAMLAGRDARSVASVGFHALAPFGVTEIGGRQVVRVHGPRVVPVIVDWSGNKQPIVRFAKLAN